MLQFLKDAQQTGVETHKGLLTTIYEKVFEVKADDYLSEGSVLMTELGMLGNALDYRPSFGRIKPPTPLFFSPLWSVSC